MKLRLMPAFAAMLFFAIGCEQDQKNKNIASSGKSNSDMNSSLFEFVPSSESKINFKNNLTESYEENIIRLQYFYNGGGVACGDLNNDGFIDLYFTGNQVQDRLYLNNGDFTFTDISDSLNLIDDGSWKTGVTMADVNNDGFLDIYICRSGLREPESRRNLLLINNGNLGFTNEAKKYGLDDAAYSSQASFFDYDRDGDLDMFLVNHQIKEFTDFKIYERANVRSPEVGDKLYRNDGGHFTDVSVQARIDQNPYGCGLAIGIADINNDQWPDVYVTNDFQENDFLYINNQDGTFTESIKSATKHNSNFGMGVDIADMNNDGLQDIMVVDMVAKDNYRQKTNMSGMNPEQFWKAVNFGFHYQYMYNTLQLNRGSEKFSEIAKLGGLSNTDWSWSTLFADFDNDGYKDLFVSNGLRKDIRNNDFAKEYIKTIQELAINGGKNEKAVMQSLLNDIPSQKIPNYMYQNQKDLTFEDKSTDWGINRPAFSTGSAYADLDNDGDLDLVVNNIDEEAHLYKNNSNELSKNHFLDIKLKGPSKNPFGYGVKIELISQNDKQYTEVYASRGFQSSVSSRVHFGLGASNLVESLVLIWPDGKTHKMSNIDANQLITIDYADAIASTNKNEESKTFFVEITKDLAIDHKHIENDYDDYADQVLLPHMLSKLGPALTVGDVNGDGLEDFFIGGASGQAGSIYLQTINGKFNKIKSSAFENHRKYEDVEALLFDADGDKDLDLYVGSGSYEFDSNSTFLIDRLYLNNGKGIFTHDQKALPSIKVSTSCIKPYDIDDDGDLDLFIGGRIIPKHYPFAPSSYLLINNKGVFENMNANLAPELKNLGLVTDAEWMNVDQDKDAELIIVGEWMQVHIFKKINGLYKLQENESNGLKMSEGWWFSVQSIDYDLDGDLDIVAGNLGLNYKYKASEEAPFKVFAGDFDDNNSTDIVLSYKQKGTYYPVRGRQCSSEQLPYVKEKFPDYKSFGMASLDQVIGPEMSKDDIELNAYTFASTIFQNDGNGIFTPMPLPIDVQLSSINDILSSDINGDGLNDLIMAGNMLYSEVETPRNDAGYGNILLGEKKNFNSLPPSQSSFFGEGEVKKIRKIRIQNSFDAYIIAKNNDVLKAYRWIGNQ